jgi:hypothetical protein
MSDPAASTITLVLVEGDREGAMIAGRPARAKSRSCSSRARSDVPVTLNVQAYFAHLDRWLASSDPRCCEFSPAA